MSDIRSHKTTLRHVRRVMWRVVKAFIIFIVPALLVIKYIKSIPQCFSAHFQVPTTEESEGSKEQTESANEKALREAIEKASRQFEQFNERFSTIFLYNIYYTNKTQLILNKEMVHDASGTTAAASSPSKEILTQAVCGDGSSTTTLSYGESMPFGEDIKLTEIQASTKQQLEHCKKLNFKYDPSVIPAEGTLVAYLQLRGESCIEAKPTIESLMIAYALFFALIIGALQLLKQGIKFIQNGFKTEDSI